MGATADLLNAQRRPEAEARRLTEAMTAALDADRDGDSLIPSAVLAETSTAFHRANQEIADEKMPSRRPVSDQHRGSFAEAPADPDFTDEQRDASAPAPLSTDRRYLISDEDEDADDAQGDEDTADPAEETAPSMPTPSDVAVVEVSEPASPGRDNEGAGSGYVDEAAEQVDYPEEAGEFGKDGDFDEGDETDDSPRTANSRFTDMPSPLDAYAGVQSSWDDQQELPVDDAPSDDENDEPVYEPDEPRPLAPSGQATAPPADIDAPEPAPEPGIKERLRDRATTVSRWVRKDRSRAKQYALIGGAAVLIIGGVFTAVHGTRGKPPLPANTVDPPPAIDNTETNADDEILVPATVSASCGNDSDAVAPFSANKNRAWVCVRINGRDLNVLNITFDKPVVITSICIVPGWDYVAPDGRDEWSRHRLATAVTWRMGGKFYPQPIAPTRTGVCKQFPSMITQEMSMTITASARPPVGEGEKHTGIGSQNSADDPSKVDETTAISSIEIRGHPVNPAG